MMPTNVDMSPVLQATTLIEQRTGLAASTQFRSDLDTILYKLSQGDIASYVQELRERDEAHPKWQRLINALTIGETYFFRDPQHFRLLRSHILPGLILERRQQKQRALNFWSVGCATGEEPYSIAIALYEFLDDLNTWTINLIGSDINAHALELARQGVYRKWAFRQPTITGDHFQQRYFDLNPDGVQLKPHIRQLVTFRRANLMSGPPRPQLDIIFCRNVLIYFKKDQISLAEDILFDSLHPGGWLILGQSEAIRFNRERWITHLFPGSAVYQKPRENLASRNGEFAYQQHVQPPLEITRTQEIQIQHTPSYLDAVYALQNDQPEAAERCLGELLAVEPDHALAHTLLGNIFASRHALPEALAHIETALRIDPLQSDAHYLRAMLYLEQGETNEAKKSLNAALYCQRNHPLASFVMGNLFAQEGDITRALRAWENTRKTISSLKPDSLISDMSDMTAGTLDALVSEQIDGWRS